METLHLSDEERSIVELIADGKTLAEIADEAAHSRSCAYDVSLVRIYRLVESLKVRCRVNTLCELIEALKEDHGNTTPE